MNCQRPYGPLNCHVVNAVFTVIPIGEYPVPEVVEVVQGPPHLVGEIFFALGYQVKQLNMHGVYDSICIFVIASLLYALRGVVFWIACIQPLALIQFLDSRKEEIYNLIAEPLCFLKLVVNVGKAAYVLDIHHLVIKIHIYIVAVALKGLYLGVAKELLKHCTSAPTRMNFAVLVNRIFIEKYDYARLRLAPWPEYFSLQVFPPP